MNGFTNGIMSMLLGWLRLLVSNLWQLVTSPDGSLLYRFMKDNWIAILVVLLIGGLIVDRVVYFLRWRPDYIWASKRAARRGRRAARQEDSPRDTDVDMQPEAPEAGEPVTAQAGYAPASYAPPAEATRKAAAYTPQSARGVSAARPAITYAPAASGYAPAVDATRKAHTFAPKADRGAAAVSSTQTYKPAAAGYAPSGAVNPTQTYKPSAASFAPLAGTTRAAAFAPHAARGNAPAGAFAPPAKAVVDGEAAGSRMNIQKQSVQPIYSARVSAAPTGFKEATAKFAPMARVSREHSAPMRDISLPADIPEPVFDDDPPAFVYSQKRDGKMSANPAKGMLNSFGNAMPEPAEYLRDMQAGYAPQLPPERMYPQPLAPLAEEASRQQVHPGLGSDAFRQSFGLDSAMPPPPPVPRQVVPPSEPPPEFKPYAQTLDELKQPSGRRINPFAAIAKKARDLVGVEDDSRKLTIRDLQPTVDMRTAFRDPVYPRPKPGDEA